MATKHLERVNNCMRPNRNTFLDQLKRINQIDRLTTCDEAKVY